MATYVLVHGAWHTGEMLEDTARPIRAMGHQVHCPTLAGNRPGDSRGLRLEDAIDSLVEYFNEHRISDAVVAGHSYAGMVISGLADRLSTGRIHRLVYWNAFVPRSGEGIGDMAPPKHAAMFQHAEEGEHRGVVLPFPVWRETFINDGDYALARKTYDQLNPHPARTLMDKLLLKKPSSRRCLSVSPILTVSRMWRCQDHSGGIRVFRRSLAFSVLSKCREVTKCASPILRFWVRS
jgi:pimeloyl-ACP methyl ester carboxylesterase